MCFTECSQVVLQRCYQGLDCQGQGQGVQGQGLTKTAKATVLEQKFNS